MEKMTREQAFNVVKTALSCTYFFSDYSDFPEYEKIEVDKDIALENGCGAWFLSRCIYVDGVSRSFAVTYTDVDGAVNIYIARRSGCRVLGFIYFDSFDSGVDPLVLCAQFVNALYLIDDGLH